MSENVSEDYALPPEVVANLRLRLKQGDGLCLNEHTINQSSDDSLHGRKKLWLTCGDATFAHQEWSWVQLQAGDHRPWVERQMAWHRTVVAEQWVGRLLAHSAEVQP